MAKTGQPRKTNRVAKIQLNNWASNLGFTQSAQACFANGIEHYTWLTVTNPSYVELAAKLDALGLEPELSYKLRHDNYISVRLRHLPHDPNDPSAARGEANDFKQKLNILRQREKQARAILARYE